MVNEFYFKSSTNQDLFAKKWYDEKIDNYNGIVQIVHGMEENIEKYNDFANFLSDNGFIVIGYDQLGHGKSVKNENELGDYNCENGWFRLAEDVHILQNKIKEEYQELPYFILGHSMGSLVLRTYATIYNDNLSGIIIIGTSGQKSLLHAGKVLTKVIELFKSKKYKSKLLEKLVGGSFNNNFKPNRTDADWLSRDEKYIDELVKNLNPNRKFTVESYLQMMNGNIYLNKMKNIKNTVNIPILITSGDKDPVGENGIGVKRVYDNLKLAGINDIEIKLFKDARHEILNEINKDEVYNFILNWINKHK